MYVSAWWSKSRAEQSMTEKVWRAYWEGRHAGREPRPHHCTTIGPSCTPGPILKLVLQELYVWQWKRRRPHQEHRTIEPSCNLRPTPACRMSQAWFNNGYYSCCWRTLQIQLTTFLSSIAKERLVDLDNIYINQYDFNFKSAERSLLLTLCVWKEST